MKTHLFLIFLVAAMALPAMSCGSGPSRRDREAANTHAASGDLYMERGEIDEALRQFDEALRLDPNHLRARFHRGLLHSSRGDYAMAVSDLSIVANAGIIALGQQGLWLELGFAQIQMRDFEAAIHSLDRTILLWDHENPFAYSLRARAHYETGDLDSAIADFETVLQLDPGDIFAMMNLDYLLGIRGR